jgi:redox-sensing transcriptional repressor
MMPMSRAPEPTVLRLSIYLRCLRKAQEEGISTLSSAGIERRTGVSAVQVRKDLSYFGDFGTSGRGYDVAGLVERLRHIMHLDEPRKAVIVGAGNMGSALAGYQGIKRAPFILTAIFDNDPAKIGRRLRDFHIQHIDALPEVVHTECVDLGIITTSLASAQEVADHMAKAGIRAILNFAPVRLIASSGVAIRNVDLVKELEVLCFYLPESINC